jgi:hypothetical protein
LNLYIVLFYYGDAEENLFFYFVLQCSRSLEDGLKAQAEYSSAVFRNWLSGTCWHGSQRITLNNLASSLMQSRFQAAMLSTPIPTKEPGSAGFAGIIMQFSYCYASSALR